MMFEDELQAATEKDNRHLLKLAADAASEATQSYFDWAKQMLSLSFAALTALVALQGNYQPDCWIARLLLWLTFGALAASVVAAAIVLRGDGWAKRALSHAYLATREKPLEERGLVHTGKPPKLADWAGNALPWCLVVAVVSLFAFGIANSVGDAEENPSRATPVEEVQE